MEEYSMFNLDGKSVKTALFSIENNVLTLEAHGKRRSWKIVEDSEFTYKFQKTQVKAAEGAEGLRRFIDKANKPDGVLNCTFFSAILNALNL